MNISDYMPLYPKDSYILSLDSRSIQSLNVSQSTSYVGDVTVDLTLVGDGARSFIDQMNNVIHGSSPKMKAESEPPAADTVLLQQEIIKSLEKKMELLREERDLFRDRSESWDEIVQGYQGEISFLREQLEPREQKEAK